MKKLASFGLLLVLLLSIGISAGADLMKIVYIFAIDNGVTIPCCDG